MKLLLVSLLTLFVVSFTITNTYSQDFIYGHKPLFTIENIKITEKIADFDDYIFTPDEHIEEAEYISETKIVNRLYKVDIKF